MAIPAGGIRAGYNGSRFGIYARSGVVVPAPFSIAPVGAFGNATRVALDPMQVSV
jgi:hypothetical protein